MFSNLSSRLCTKYSKGLFIARSFLRPTQAPKVRSKRNVHKERYDVIKDESGLVIYENDSFANRKMVRTARIFVGVNIVTLVVMGETIYMVRERDHIENEVNRSVETNLYTGQYGFLLLPAVSAIAALVLFGTYFYVGRVVKKIYYQPKQRIITVITHNLFGKQTLFTAQASDVNLVSPGAFQVKNYRSKFLINDEVEVPNRRLFNMVMGAHFVSK